MAGHLLVFRAGAPRQPGWSVLVRKLIESTQYEIVTMTIWIPEIEESGPVYLAITRALESDIAAGRIEAGDRLPTHRELASRLGVNVGTVSRAYAEARRRGLVQGEVGRGTYVRSSAPSPLSNVAPAGGPTDLSVNTPPPEPAAGWREALLRLADAPDLETRLGYGDPRGPERLRRAGADFLAGFGVDTHPDELVVCAGAQHAILVALAASVGPGESVVCEPLTYPGFLAAARTLGLRVRTVECDVHGIVPEALEALCLAERPRALYCMPALQNPTASLLPEDRRRRIAALAERFDLTLIRDDIQTGIVDDPLPCLSTLAPRHTLSIVSLSKSLAPGLRVAFLAGRGLDPHRAHDAVWSTVWMGSPIGAEIACDWLESGRAAERIQQLRQELAARHRIAVAALDGIPIATRPGAQHIWLRLPAPWDGARFASELERRGVRVSPAEAFQAEPGPTLAAVRLSISAPADHASLSRALETVAQLWRSHDATGRPRL